MTRSLLGVGVHDFGMGTKTALSRAAGMGFNAVELGTAAGDTSPDQLSQSGRGHLQRLVSGLGMELSAFDAATPGGGFADPKHVDERIARTKATLDLARDVSVPIVIVALGAMVDGSGRESTMDALREVGDHADRIGRTLAVHTHGHSPESLESLLRAVECPAIRVCMDPAALLMMGHDPIEGIRLLADRVCLSHARDATLGGSDRAGHETPLGEGHVDLPAYLAALDGAGYGGPQIIRRTGAEHPLEDIRRALAILDSHLGRG